jgi:hypothetical protein
LISTCAVIVATVADNAQTIEAGLIKEDAPQSFPEMLRDTRFDPQYYRYSRIRRFRRLVGQDQIPSSAHAPLLSRKICDNVPQVRHSRPVHFGGINPKGTIGFDILACGAGRSIYGRAEMPRDEAVQAAIYIIAWAELFLDGLTDTERLELLNLLNRVVNRCPPP